MAKMTFEGAVNGAAAWYARRCWWIDLEDLRQEAWMAVLEAQERPTFDKCRSLEDQAGYMYQVAIFKLKEYVWSQSSPVTGPKGRRNKLRGTYRAPLSALYNRAADDPSTAEAEERWWAELSEAVQQIVRTGPRGGVAARVLPDREKPALVAEAERLSIYQVWHASSNARRRIKADLDLHYAMVQGAQPS